MKKITLGTIAISSLLLAFTTVNANAAKFFSSLNPQTKISLADKAKLHPPTDVTVINATSNYIYAVVPGVINDSIAPGDNDHLYSYDPHITSITLVLKDPLLNVFYTRDVCPLAIVTAFGYPGAYRITNDMELC